MVRSLGEAALRLYSPEHRCARLSETPLGEASRWCRRAARTDTV